MARVVACPCRPLHHPPHPPWPPLAGHRVPRPHRMEGGAQGEPRGESEAGEVEEGLLGHRSEGEEGEDQEGKQGEEGGGGPGGAVLDGGGGGGEEGGGGKL